ncbi:SDR family oxidoreductase [Parashewanella tropica]|uniref:SDR family oxidoreductase n=1 Tax=Parashewanella tropica TaxID=2547970 RepID=UPI00105A1716|nr:SDR family oxidoreductase [Parashewanella tropica]
MSTSVLITGSNSGFGYLMAKTLLQQGFFVVASMRHSTSKHVDVANDLRQQGALVVDIDVTDEQSVNDGVAESIAIQGHIDVLINNAGFGSSAWLQSCTIDDFNAIFDVNVFGVQRMIRAVLPHMRQRRQGTLIQISSTLGQFVLPYMGVYNASKHALEALTETYRVELSQFGIQSLLVQPGAFGTPFSSNLIAGSDTEITQSYDKLADAPDKQVEYYNKVREQGNNPDPQMVADAVLKLLQMKPEQRPFRTLVDGTCEQHPVEEVNRSLETAMQKLYQSYPFGELLTLNQTSCK